jgi:hypothetical protein
MAFNANVNNISVRMLEETRRKTTDLSQVTDKLYLISPELDSNSQR